MSLIVAQIKKPAPYLNSFFTLKVKSGERATKIRMEMLIPIFTTKELTETYSVLKKNLPSILRSKCFNENNYKFSKEVKNTEIGHLFEHILLEYICNLKYLSGIKNPVHNGLTSWNWQKDLPGSFNINIDVPRSDLDILNIAIKKSCNLLAKILKTSPEIQMHTLQSLTYSV